MVYRRDFRRPTLKDRPGFFSRWSVTWILIFVNVLIFFLFGIFGAFFDSSLEITSKCTGDIINSTYMTELTAIQSCNIISGDNLWTFLTSMFRHNGFFHIFVNMFSLFFLGGLVERIIGRKRFFLFYLLAGLVGSLFFVLGAFGGQFIPRGDFLFGGMDDYAVGASGAIFGILGLLAIILPAKEIYLIVGPLVVIVLQFVAGHFVPAISGVLNVFASILIFFMIFSVFSFSPTLRKIAMPLRLPFWLAPIVAIVPLFVIGFFVKLPIGNSAHLGGLVAGLVYGGYLRSKYRQKVKLLNKMVR